MVLSQLIFFTGFSLTLFLFVKSLLGYQSVLVRVHIESIMCDSHISLIWLVIIYLIPLQLSSTCSSTGQCFSGVLALQPRVKTNSDKYYFVKPFNCYKYFQVGCHYHLERWLVSCFIISTPVELKCPTMFQKIFYL